MEFPLEIQRHINDFAKPVTRVDWRQGSAMSRHHLFFDIDLKLILISDQFYLTLTQESYLEMCIFFFGYGVNPLNENPYDI